ncbi:hypothetical protein [Moorena sp. SIO4G3]|uniref:hypothetical protein n=1 Tax=Moorena sp. SIO4G3 TaxID=2607821 RepID=UPI00142D0617|nr:hypothetical protein [Moorena sp. SIO4G3]NEO81311.1 hypothetical protein [Moorena sp. SIO4G3]
MTLVPPKVGGLGGQNSVSKNLGDILLAIRVGIERIFVPFSLLPVPCSLFPVPCSLCYYLPYP